MNKSEIAEKTARELLAVAQDTYPLDEKLIGLFQARIERAIAESQAQREMCNDCLWLACVPHQCSCKCHAELGDGEPSPPLDEELCQKCGRNNPVWFAPNLVWNAVVTEISGLLCPICFIERADKQGFRCTGWELIPENSQIEPVDTRELKAALTKKIETAVIAEIMTSTGPTGGWLDSPKAVCAALLKGIRDAVAI